MDQLRLEQYHILFERMIRCTSDPQHFDREEFVQVLREFGILFRLSKGVTEFYRSEGAEKAHDGEIMVDYDTGQKGHPVLEKRFITKSGAVIRSTMFMADGEEPLSREEQEKLELIIFALLGFIGRNRLEISLERLGFYDDEEYPNLRFFLRFLDSLISEDRISGYTTLCYNISHFSVINQEIGKSAGDIVMRNYYDILKESVGDDAAVCRIGGDNFVMAFRKDLKEQVLQILSGIPVFCDPEEKSRILVSASAGIFDIPAQDPPAYPGEIMNRIFTAMQMAKHKPDDRVAYYDEKMLSMRDSYARVHLLFPKALRDNEFRVFYQPKVDIESGRIIGAEALCRWYHDGKIVPPVDFIPALEQNADICLLDFHMLDLVCKDIRRWLDEGKQVIRISVNLSRNHLFDVDLNDHILEIIDRNRVPHHCIEIELTESATEVGFKALKRISGELQESGVVISVDDFGMGYSSLNLIREIPWNVLKIDRCFLPSDDEPEDSVTSLMYKHVITMARDIGLECVTEGVETKKQVEILKKNHCTIAQGYYFDKPLSVEEYEDRLIRGYYDTDITDNL